MVRIHSYATTILVLCFAVGALADQQASIAIEAVAGEPLGVGRMTVRVAAEGLAARRPDQPMWLAEQNKRAFYPTFDVAQVSADELQYTVHFLFRGSDELKLKLVADRAYAHSVKPAPSQRRASAKTAGARLLREWWIAWTTPVDDAYQQYADPVATRTYLVSMLARRMQLKVPETFAPARPLGLLGQYRELESFVHLLLGTASMRAAMQQETLLTVKSERLVPDRQLPRPGSLPPMVLPAPVGDVPIESMARHVPEECFYARFTNFNDYRWFRSTVEQWGGNLTSLVEMRGVEYGTREKVEKQLALYESEMVRLFEKKAVFEFALIGTDTFLREGAAIGVLLKAADRGAVDDSIRLQRRARMKEVPGAREWTIQIDGTAVSFLSTPDNRVRSFHAVDGRYHLITTSKYLVQRFLEAGREDGKSLGALPEFRYARSKVPVSRNDAVFLYLSDPFIRMLINPQYRVEMTRRARALVDLEIVQLAKLAARAEGRESDSVMDLVNNGFLPDALDRRADGSHPVLQNGHAFDSLRGYPGHFVPVPDIPVKTVTRAEESAYWKFIAMYRGLWRRMDPIIITASPVQSDQPGRQRINIDVTITPYARTLYQQFSMLIGQRGDRHRLAPLANNVVTIEANSIYGGNQKLIAGVGDFEIRHKLANGEIDASVPLWTEIPGYIAATPTAGIITWLVKDQFGQPDAQGYASTQRQFNLVASNPLSWRRKWGDWIAFAPKKSVLQTFTPELKLERADRPAQLCFRLNDLSEKKISGIIRAYSYIHARRLSSSNVRFLHQLMQQFQTGPREARRAAERLVRGKLDCPLDGAYRLDAEKDDAPQWISSAWAKPSLYDETAIPKDYRFGFLDWFHGMSIDFDLTRTTLTAHVKLDIEPGDQVAQAVAARADIVAELKKTVARMLAGIEKMPDGEEKIKRIELLIEDYPDTEFADRASRMLVNIRAGAMLDAAREIDEDLLKVRQLLKLIAEYPDADPATEAQELLAATRVAYEKSAVMMYDIAMTLSDPRQERALEQLIEQFPESKASLQAQSLLNGRRADRLLALARKQLKTKGVEQVGRRTLRRVIVDYPGTSAAKDALATYRLQLAPMMLQALRTPWPDRKPLLDEIATQFPDTPQGRKAGELLKTESDADERLRMAKELMTFSPENGRQWLIDLVREFRGTQAANEAQQILKQKFTARN